MLSYRHNELCIFFGYMSDINDWHSSQFLGCTPQLASCGYVWLGGERPASALQPLPVVGGCCAATPCCTRNIYLGNIDDSR